MKSISLKIVTDRNQISSYIFENSLLLIPLTAILAILLIYFFETSSSVILSIFFSGWILAYFVQLSPQMFKYKKLGSFEIKKSGFHIITKGGDKLIPYSKLKVLSFDFIGLSKWVGTRIPKHEVCTSNKIIIQTEQEKIEYKFITSRKSDYIYIKQILKKLKENNIEINLSGVSFTDLKLK